MSGKHDRARAERRATALFQAHDLLHKDDVPGCHAVLHRALGLRDEEIIDPASLAKPMPLRLSDFDREFRQLCSSNGVVAVYFAEDGTRLMSGGAADLIVTLDAAVRRGLGL